MSDDQPDISIALVVARAQNGVIGRDGDMPWRLPSDLKHFKAVTLGAPVIMGRKTYQSIGRSLPGRANIVVSRSGFIADGVETAPDLKAAIARGCDLARQSGADKVSIIGGGQIYAQAMALADQLHVTEVDAVIEGDTIFPAIDSQDWERATLSDPVRGENDSHSVRFALWRRRAA
ncbi:dihydrofolate reductase [Hoeflea sp. G2-23]|uniref:Dihydrofolate reductase n=1 Tax=Hoeflea algicola TaxID=2983763 RepID=A0ABT3Z3A8_9HYPH|nr:dihydrofolate reductase [Hoeflea algicola]MCY0146247.1 dihydrofolate reductase [Hoeflea algicola]